MKIIKESEFINEVQEGLVLVDFYVPSAPDIRRQDLMRMF